MSASEGYEDIDAAKVLDVAEDASEADIRKAYVSASLRRLRPPMLIGVAEKEKFESASRSCKSGVCFSV